MGLFVEGRVRYDSSTNPFIRNDLQSGRGALLGYYDSLTAAQQSFELASDGERFPGQSSLSANAGV